MISNHIEDLITAEQAHPNSLWRNKTVSHLQNALATSKMEEADVERAKALKRLTGPANGQLGHVSNGSAVCICPVGAVDAKCLVHNSPSTFRPGGPYDTPKY